MRFQMNNQVLTYVWLFFLLMASLLYSQQPDLFLPKLTIKTKPSGASLYLLYQDSSFLSETPWAMDESPDGYSTQKILVTKDSTYLDTIIYAQFGVEKLIEIELRERWVPVEVVTQLKGKEVSCALYDGNKYLGKTPYQTTLRCGSFHRFNIRDEKYFPLSKSLSVPKKDSLGTITLNLERIFNPFTAKCEILVKLDRFGAIPPSVWKDYYQWLVLEGMHIDPDSIITRWTDTSLVQIYPNLIGDFPVEFKVGKFKYNYCSFSASQQKLSLTQEQKSYKIQFSSNAVQDTGLCVIQLDKWGQNKNTKILLVDADSEKNEYKPLEIFTLPDNKLEFHYVYNNKQSGIKKIKEGLYSFNQLKYKFKTSPNYISSSETFCPFKNQSADTIRIKVQEKGTRKYYPQETDRTHWKSIKLQAEFENTPKENKAFQYCYSVYEPWYYQKDEERGYSFSDTLEYGKKSFLCQSNWLDLLKNRYQLASMTAADTLIFPEDNSVVIDTYFIKKHKILSNHNYCFVPSSIIENNKPYLWQAEMFVEGIDTLKSEYFPFENTPLFINPCFEEVSWNTYVMDFSSSYENDFLGLRQDQIKARYFKNTINTKINLNTYQLTAFQDHYWSYGFDVGLLVPDISCEIGLYSKYQFKDWFVDMESLFTTYSIDAYYLNNRIRVRPRCFYHQLQIRKRLSPVEIGLGYTIKNEVNSHIVLEKEKHFNDQFLTAFFSLKIPPFLNSIHNGDTYVSLTIEKSTQYDKINYQLQLRYAFLDGLHIFRNN